jgi:hypothetical protein
MAATAKTLTETVDTKFGPLKVVLNRETGEIIPEKIELIRVPRVGGGVDPAVEDCAKHLEESKLAPEEIVRRSVKLGRPIAAATVLGIKFRATKRPQNYTIDTIMMCLDFDKIWTRRVQAKAPLRGKPEPKVTGAGE